MCDHFLEDILDLDNDGNTDASDLFLLGELDENDDADESDED